MLHPHYSCNVSYNGNIPDIVERMLIGHINLNSYRHNNNLKNESTDISYTNNSQARNNIHFQSPSRHQYRILYPYVITMTEIISVFFILRTPSHHGFDLGQILGDFGDCIFSLLWYNRPIIILSHTTFVCI